MSKKVAAIVVLVIIASLVVAGCSASFYATNVVVVSPLSTPAPTVSTPTPPVDYSSILAEEAESANFIMEQPFTRSTNTRGNDVYTGVGRNASMPDSPRVTLVFELVYTKAEAKQVFDKEVATKLKEGYYTYNPEKTARWKAQNPSALEARYGDYGNSWFYCGYVYDTEVHSWMVFEQSAASSQAVRR